MRVAVLPCILTAFTRSLKQRSCGSAARNDVPVLPSPISRTKSRQWALAPRDGVPGATRILGRSHDRNGSFCARSPPPTESVGSAEAIVPDLDRDLPRREPQITLRRITRCPAVSVRRVDRSMLRPQPPHVLSEPGDRPRPLDPLRDHRRRHRRMLRQQRSDSRFERGERRRLRQPLILRRPVRRQRPIDRRPTYPQLPRDLPLRNSVRDQPPNQRPIFH